MKSGKKARPEKRFVPVRPKRESWENQHFLRFAALRSLTRARRRKAETEKDQ